MKIATWNVNSVKARLQHLLAWLKSAQPDVALLQELKCIADAFPRLEIEDLGYNCAVIGQKSYNGVAILSKRPMEDLLEGLPGDKTDTQARYLEATVEGVRVASLYLPNGNPVASEKYPYKLAWMARLEAHVRDRLALEEPLILGGDYNVAPSDEDVYDPARFKDDALARPETRRAFRSLLNLGLTEAFRALHREPHLYSYWDYGRAFDDDEGDRLASCEIDREPRKQAKPSDHTPVCLELRD
jgi:exodeoxyribonuclease-3